MKPFTLKGKKLSKVNWELLNRSLRTSKELAKAGFGRGRLYSLPPIDKHRLVKTTRAEIAALQED